jgi:NAD(P)-dependent dehydrogenase (short-subunit alcohol dehydrogenase family)
LRQSSAPGAALYVASKHAVEGFTKAAALEFAETGVRINVVAPGTIETGMLNRFAGTPERSRKAILFLASDVTCRRWRGTLRLDGSCWHF